MPQLYDHSFLEPLSSGYRLAVAHRGGAHLPGNIGIENTIAAFTRATELGYRYLETDVHCSRDGIVFAFHDDTLYRLTGDPTPIRRLDACQIERVRLAGTEPIPRMSDLLTVFGHCKFSIDIKSDHAVEPMLTLAADHRDRICLASFSARRLQRVRSALPDALTVFAPREIATLKLAVSQRTRACGPASGGGLMSAPISHRGIPVVTRAFVRRAHRLGIAVVVWTIDDPQTLHELFDSGVDGVFTDRPDVLKDVLQQRGQWDDRSQRGQGRQ